jgi:hypothetical protein
MAMLARDDELFLRSGLEICDGCLSFQLQKRMRRGSLKLKEFTAAYSRPPYSLCGTLVHKMPFFKLPSKMPQNSKAGVLYS